MSNTRTKIMNLAEKLIRTKGYHAFSYKDISAPLQIKNAAVHYHFPAKADLGEAIISRTIRTFELQTEEWKPLSPEKKLEAFINIYRESKEQNMVCFMGALGPSYDSLPDNMKAELTIASNQIRLWLREVLQEGKDKGLFDFSETIEEKADTIVTALLSSLILSIVSQEDVLQTVSKAIPKAL